MYMDMFCVGVVERLSILCLFVLCVHIYIYIWCLQKYKLRIRRCPRGCFSFPAPSFCICLVCLFFFLKCIFSPLLFLPCLLFLFVVVFVVVVAMNSSSSSGNGFGEDLSFHLINFIYNLLRRNHLPLSSSF